MRVLDFRQTSQPCLVCSNGPPISKVRVGSYLSVEGIVWFAFSGHQYCLRAIRAESMDKVEDFQRQTMLLLQSIWLSDMPPQKWKSCCVLLQAAFGEFQSLSKRWDICFLSKHWDICFSPGSSKSKTMAFIAFHPCIYRICIAINLSALKSHWLIFSTCIHWTSRLQISQSNRKASHRSFCTM